MELLIGIVIGFIISLAITMIATFSKHKTSGNLRVDESDPDSPPLLFLELTEDLNKVKAKKIITLAVRLENYISQK